MPVWVFRPGFVRHSQTPLILEQQHLDGAAGRLPMAQQPCREHAGVVHHQTVARLQQVDQIIKMPVRDLTGLPVERHQA